MRPAILNREAETRRVLATFAEGESETDLGDEETSVDNEGLKFTTVTATKPTADLEWMKDDNEPEIFERTQKVEPKNKGFISKISTLMSTGMPT